MVNLSIDASDEEAMAFSKANYQRAQANHQRALDNFKNVWPPWRWLQCLREDKAIGYEIKMTERASRESRAWIKHDGS